MPLIDNVDINALFPVEERKEVFEGAKKISRAMQLLTRLPNGNSNALKLRILEALPLVYWQGSNTSFKKTSNQKWGNKYIYYEELAVIVPISINDLRDANYDVWGSVRPRIEEAIAKKIDQAVFLGVDKPDTFPEGILDQAFSHGHQLAQGSDTFYKVVSDAMGLVEEDGYEPNGILGSLGLKKRFRNLVDTTGQLITGSEIAALPRHFVDNGAWDKTKADFIVGDFREAVYSIREDIEFDILKEATIVDPATKDVVYALAQQDMVALRATFRFGWQLPNPVNATNPNESTRLPFAVVVPSAPVVKVTGPESATFEEAIDVELSANVGGATIYYTDNGDAPTTSSTKYIGKIHLTATKTIKAIAVVDGYTSDTAYSETFTLAEAEVGS